MDDIESKIGSLNSRGYITFFVNAKLSIVVTQSIKNQRKMLFQSMRREEFTFDSCISNIWLFLEGHQRFSPMFIG